MCDSETTQRIEPWKVYVGTQILYLKPAVTIAITGIAYRTPIVSLETEGLAQDQTNLRSNFGLSVFSPFLH